MVLPGNPLYRLPHDPPGAEDRHGSAILPSQERHVGAQLQVIPRWQSQLHAFVSPNSATQPRAIPYKRTLAYHMWWLATPHYQEPRHPRADSTFGKVSSRISPPLVRVRVGWGRQLELYRLGDTRNPAAKPNRARIERSESGRRSGRGALRSPLAEDQIHSYNYGGRRAEKYREAKQRPLPPRQFHTHPLQPSNILLHQELSVPSSMPRYASVRGGMTLGWGPCPLSRDSGPFTPRPSSPYPSPPALGGDL